MLTGRLHELGARDLAFLVYALVRLTHAANTALLDETVAVQLAAAPGWMSLKGKADITWAYASLGYVGI